MKKIQIKHKERDKRNAVKLLKIHKRQSGRKKFKKLRDKYQKKISILSELEINRLIFISKYYTRERFKPGKTSIKIDDEFGIEERSTIDNYFKYAQRIISAKTTKINIDLKNCTRIWPSGITLLCAFREWIRVKAHKTSKPTVGHYNPENIDVNRYLSHCGFCDFVKTTHKIDDEFFNNSKIIKIQHETTKNTELREKEIKKMLEQYTQLTSDELEIFDDRISTEIFNNVTEHGIPWKDAGWWILAQHHDRHQIISLCIADNGIGIRNSLMTGPQRESIKDILKNTPLNEGLFIQKAIEKNVSGAFTAPIKEQKFLGIVEQFPRGEKRGKGLQRITQNCARLGIKLTILSRHGVFMQDRDGTVMYCTGFGEQIFSGTMYHLSIQATKNYE